MSPSGDGSPIYLGTDIPWDGIDKSNGGRALVIRKILPAVGGQRRCADLRVPFQYDYTDDLFAKNRVRDPERNTISNRVMLADDLIDFIGINVFSGSNDYFLDPALKI